MTGPQVRVNSWNSWDPLRRVIIGRAEATMVQAPEPAIRRDWPEHGFPLGSYGPIPQEMTAAATEQLDNLADLLRRRGIEVDRPEPLDFSQPVSTPLWTQGSMFGCMPARDVLITIGNEILESTMSYRSRWFEYLCYRPLIEAYYRSDPDARWEAAPKPRLTDASYHAGFWDEYRQLSRAEQLERVRASHLVLTEAEPLFDAADICPVGKDLFVQLSLVTNRSGYRWIRQHFPGHRVHAVTFGATQPMHIDATWVPLRPGLVLHCAEREADPELLGYFKANDWQVVGAASPMRGRDQLPPFSICSPWLSMNVLSLDAGTICVEATETATADQLSDLGFEVIPVPFWAAAPFGGGLHCATADIERDGGPEDYFPNRYGRF